MGLPCFLAAWANVLVWLLGRAVPEGGVLPVDNDRLRGEGNVTRQSIR